MEVDDIWASMLNGEKELKAEYQKRSATIKAKSNLDVSLTDLMNGQDKKVKTKKRTGQQNQIKGATKVENTPQRVFPDVLPEKTVESSSPDLLPRIGREINGLSSDNAKTRQKACQRLHNVLFVENRLSGGDYNDMFHENCKAIFKLFADPAEICREQSMRITLEFFKNSTNFVPILGYFVPCIMQRLPSGLAFDEEMKVFVSDMEAHEAYRRGKAVVRQDKGGTAGLLSHTIVEQSEELRLLMCQNLNCLIERSIDLGAASILHPYFHDIVIFLQHQLKDPFPTLKMEASNALQRLALEEEYVPGMKFFAVALVRAILPVLRQRHAKVRLSGVKALKACMMVPDHAKRKGAGTDAICDLVGFREENVLQVAAFYTSDVQINYLAELMGDKSAQVREAVVDMLTAFLTELGDRYDHQTRLLPYLLDLVTDECSSVSTPALACLAICGRQYEEEHQDEIIERRQYGVDGDERINLDKPLPAPFSERPRLGVRLYVRGNTKRFLNALVGELTNWQAQTRMKSASLLKVIIVLCEEHLTMEAFSLLPSFIKAIYYAKKDADPELHKALMEAFEHLGRYMLPESYLHYILPRLRGDEEVMQFGADTLMRLAVLDFLNALLNGSKPSQLLPHLSDIVDVLSDPFVVDVGSVALNTAALDVIVTLLQSLGGRGKAAVEAHFMATGRLTSLQGTMGKLFRFLLLGLTDAPLNAKAAKGLKLLVEFDVDPSKGLKGLFLQHGPSLLRRTMQDLCADGTWCATTPENRLLCALVKAPWDVVLAVGAGDLLSELLHYLCVRVNESSQLHFVGSASEVDFLLQMSGLADYVLQGFAYSSYRRHFSTCFACSEFGELQRDVVGADGHRDPVLARMLQGQAGKVKAIVETYVLHERWRRHQKLLSCSMKLFATLLGSADEYTQIFDPSRDIKDLKVPSTIALGDLVPSRPAMLSALGQGQGYGEEQEQGVERLQDAVVAISCLGSILSAAKAVSNPVALRLWALELVRHATFPGGPDDDLPPKPLSFDTRRRLRLGSNRKDVVDGSSSTLLLPSYRGLNSELELQQLCLGVDLVGHAMDMLDDGNDEVRVSAMAALSSAVVAGFVLDDNFDAEYSISLRDRLMEGGPSPGGHPLFSNVVLRLLREIPQSAPVDELSTPLDMALRHLSVLDVKKFESLLRSKSESWLGKREEGTAPIQAFVSALISHCDILLQFSKQI